MCQKEFLLFYMCQLWALHVVTKRQFFLHLLLYEAMSTPSGAKKRKRLKDVEKREQLFLKKVPKLSHFFAAGSE